MTLCCLPLVLPYRAMGLDCKDGVPSLTSPTSANELADLHGLFLCWKTRATNIDSSLFAL
jgi:hypothetical protein